MNTEPSVAVVTGISVVVVIGLEATTTVVLFSPTVVVSSRGDVVLSVKSTTVECPGNRTINIEIAANRMNCCFMRHLTVYSSYTTNIKCKH